MKNVLGSVFFAGCLLSGAGTVHADVDCTDMGADCQAIYGQVIQLIIDNGAALSAYSGLAPVTTKTDPYLMVKINGGASSATNFGGCEVYNDEEAIGLLALDTDARKAIYASLVTARTTLQDISMVVDVNSTTPICEIAAISFE